MEENHYLLSTISVFLLSRTAQYVTLSVSQSLSQTFDFSVFRAEQSRAEYDNYNHYNHYRDRDSDLDLDLD